MLKRLSVIRGGNKGVGIRSGAVALFGGMKVPEQAGDFEQPSSQLTIETAIYNLREALDILDQLQMPAHLGARLQDVIDRIEEMETT